MADFELQNLDQVLGNLQNWGDRVVAAADDAVVVAAADAASLARDRVRVRTGDLQRSITSQRIAWGFAVVEAGSDGVGYARVVEARTRFFSTPVDKIQRQLRARVSSAIGRAAFS